MDRENRPRGREKNVKDGSASVYKRGEGLGMGPVGSSDGYAGKSGDAAGPNTERSTVTRGSSSMMRVVLIIAALLIFGGGGSASGLFGSLLGGGSPTGTQQTYTQQTQTQQTTQSSSNTGASLNTTVAQGAREKRTQILGNGNDQITFMIYMCGTDLESKSAMATSDIREMMEASFSDKINVVLYTGGCLSWRNNVVSSRVNQIYQVKDGELICVEQDVGSVAMTDPNTLSSFIQYCAKNYPANRNNLIFWDHGGGSVSGYGYDEKFKSSGGMTLAGVKSALEKGGVTFDFIGFDACLMATVENALMLDDFADYLIASEETEPGIGWYYTNWLTQLSRNTSMPTTELGKLIIDEFIRACNTNCPGQKTTLSIIDLAELSATAPEKLSGFSKSISSLLQEKEYKAVSDARYQTREFAQSSRIDQVDLVNLAENMGTAEGKDLAAALKDAVKYNRTSANMSNANGVSIYFPYQSTRNVDSAVNTYNQIGMDESYAACIREFAALETSGQVVAGGSSSPMPSLLGTLMEQGTTGGGLSSSDMVGQLLNTFMSGSFGVVDGLSSSNTGFLFGRSMPDDELVDYLTEYQFDASQLVWQSKGAETVISLREEQWDLVHALELNAFYDDGEGYIDLGTDNVYSFDDDGDLLLPTDRTWLSVNDHIVAYYYLDTYENGEEYTITGRAPALLNGDRVDLILVFDNETPNGYIAGATYDYVNGETETIAKSLSEIEVGDTLEFLCDYYSYEGVYEDSYLLGEPLTVAADMEIANIAIDDGALLLSFRFTDIYNREYWSETLTVD